VTEVVERIKKLWCELSGNGDTTRKEHSMNRDMEIKSGSTILARINTVRMSDAERQVALAAMQDADALVGAIAWLAKKIEQVGERLFLKPALKH
jgi:hypothetical protein